MTVKPIRTKKSISGKKNDVNGKKMPPNQEAFHLSGREDG